VSEDATFREMKEVQALVTSATDDVTKLVDKKRLEIET
jgi:hypothetical protein